MWADVVQTDSGLTSAIAEHVLAGKHLPIAYSSFFTQLSSNPGGNPDFQVVLSRGFSRLKGIFATLYCPPGTGGVGAGEHGSKQVNSFWCWHGVQDHTAAYDRFDCFFSIGNRVIPEYHVRSFSEAWYRLRLAVGKYASTESLSIAVRAFRAWKFVLAVDLETGALQSGGGLAHTGLNTRSGELLTLQAKGFSRDQATEGPREVYVSLHYDAIISVGLDNTQVLD